MWVRVVLGFLNGAVVHLVDLIGHGVVRYPELPLALNLYFGGGFTAPGVLVLGAFAAFVLGTAVPLRRWLAAR